MQRIGIRHEDKNAFERRAPLTPADVGRLTAEHGVQVVLQPSDRRVFSDEEYRAAGATIAPHLEDCPVVLGVKEIPPDRLSPGTCYVFFSHTSKGQPHNMPMLRRLLELSCTLIDYEKITDERGYRLVHFSRFAGLAGMIDTLWALGQRLALEGTTTALAALRPAHTYASLEQARAAVAEAGRAFRAAGVPPALRPLVFGLAGYGKVSSGAQEILGLLGPRSLTAAELPGLDGADGEIYQVVFREEDMVEPLSGAFLLLDYYASPERYRPVFARHLSHLTVLVNCVYWEPRYPRLVRLQDLAPLYAPGATPRLRLIGDLSCDVQGSIEITQRATTPAQPVYVVEVDSGRAIDGFAGRGPVVLAVENLPAELPRDASETFSAALSPLVPALAQADLAAPLRLSGLPDPLRRAVIAYHGQLTDAFAHLAQHL